MANFFTDNADIQFHMAHMDFGPITRLQEEDFADAERFDYAPEDEADAVDSYRRVLEVVGQIAGETIAPASDDVDREGCVLEDGKVTYAAGTRKSLKALSQADLMGFTLPRRYGGLNCPNIIYTVATEIVSRADASLMTIFGLQGIAETINAFASEEQKAVYLPKFCSGEVTGAMVLTEPDAGSDLQSIQLQAYQGESGEWFLRGVKRFITNGCGEVLLVLARSEPDETGGMGLSLFICDRNDRIRVRRIEDKLGIHGSPTCELQFNDCPAQLVGERRRGLVTYVMALMNGARVGIAAQSVGIAEAAFREARIYAYHRQQFGRRIQEFPAVADLLAEMRLEVEAARALLYETSLTVDMEYGLLRKMARTEDQDERSEINKKQKRYKRLASLLTPIAKYWCSEMANRVAYEAVGILGGSGYMKDYPSERYMRDARITSIYEGTSQLQVLAAVRGVTSGTAERRFVELEARGQPKGFKAFCSQLKKLRRRLAETVEYLKKEQAPDYLDLFARKLVDVAADIYIGYLFLGAVENSNQKKEMAKRWLRRAVPRAFGTLKLISSGDRSTLDKFSLLVGPVPEEA
ncbi:MAG: acyl-CoA dehydrogenase family protein [Planctomycetia bacterium]|nr:acyl-CoA dehydrogenase family protein [Planctomycetia bacterium]